MSHCCVFIDFICDRGIDPLVYAAVYLGSDSASRLMQTDVARRLVERYAYCMLSMFNT